MMAMGFLQIDCSDKYVRDGRRIVNLDHVIQARWEYKRRDPDPDALYLVLDLTGEIVAQIPDGPEAKCIWERLRVRSNLGFDGDTE